MIPLGVLAARRPDSGGITDLPHIGVISSVTVDVGSWSVANSADFPAALNSTGFNVGYMHSTTNGSAFTATIDALNIAGSASVGSVSVEADKASEPIGTTTYNMGIVIGGVTYWHPTTHAGNLSTSSPYTHTSTFATNPATSSAWTPAAVNGITAVTLRAPDAQPKILIGRLQIIVNP